MFMYVLTSSQDEIDARLMQQFETKPFKARPLNQSIMNSAGDFGVPKIAKQALSQPISPNLSTKRRAASNKHKQVDNENLHRACLNSAKSLNNTLNSTLNR
jgi:hypothetical protein